MRMKPPTVTVPLVKRKAGRRSISNTSAPSADVHVTLDPVDYDKTYAIAARKRISVPEVLRRALKDWPAFLTERVPRGTKIEN